MRLVSAFVLVMGCGGEGLPGVDVNPVPAGSLSDTEQRSHEPATPTVSSDGGPDACASDQDCSQGQVCDSFLRTCARPTGSCRVHTDCAAASYCERSRGVCLPAGTGTPCASDANCDGTCAAGLCGCDGLVFEQKLSAGALDVYMILDRSGSMGDDCDYKYGATPPVESKACYATYALSDYAIRASPSVDTRLAFNFFSLEQNCEVAPYATPRVGLTQLPVAASDTLVQEISNETFGGHGLQTRMAPALLGIASFTANNRTPGREMIGVLMTDGDANECESNVAALAKIIADHRAATGLKTYIIGMDGATEEKLEQLAIAGGAEPHDDFCGSRKAPCHYWNVGKGSGDVVTKALSAIVEMAAPIPCKLAIGSLQAPAGETLNYDRINVTLTQGDDVTTIGSVSDQASCPNDKPAWYYDDRSAPKEINLCPGACQLVSRAGNGARVNLVVGCQSTVTLF